MTLRLARFVIAAITAATALSPMSAHAAACAGADHPAGEWPSYGRDLANSRNQPAETTIDSTNVDSLSADWVFSFTSAGADGNVHATPVTSGGCVFVASDTGWIVALDAGSGDLVWKTKMPVAGQVPGIFSLAVQDGRVHGATADENGPFGFALAVGTGVELWRSPSLAQLGTTVNASTVLYDGVQVVSIWGDDPNPEHHNGFAFLDAASGALQKTTFVIPQEQWEEGYAGGSVWATPVIDEDGFGYVGTANPYSKRFEHDNTNAIIKFDVRRTSETFGEIVDSYKGTPDNYVEALYDTPVCQTVDPTPEGSYNFACGQLDIDFGASPNLFEGPDGRTLVGAVQKSGVFHAAFTDTMDAAWSNVVSAPILLGNAGTSTVVGDSVVASANPGIVWSFSQTDGSLEWIAPLLDGVRYQAMSSANGVVYTTSGWGILHAFDASSGTPLLVHNIADDAPDAGTALLTSAGVAIARNTLFAPHNGFVVAYRLPA